jgi:hypothetical protein
MKKLGFIAISLVTVLATLGIGFSMWSQTVTINGQVSTGNVNLTVSNPSCDIYFKDLDADVAHEPAGSNVWGYMVTNGSGQPVFDGNGVPVIDLSRPLFYEQPDHGWAITPSDYLAVGWAAISSFNNAAIGGPTVVATWHNIFPWPWPSSVTYPAGAPSSTFATQVCDFDVTNNGNIPVKLNIGIDSSLLAGSGLNVEIGWYNPSNGQWLSSGLQGMQLEPLSTVHVQIGLTPDESTTQGFNGSFTVTIQGVQWNEYAPPADQVGH